MLEKIDSQTTGSCYVTTELSLVLGWKLQDSTIKFGLLARLLLNPSKCELYGDSTFPEFPKGIIRLTEGVTLLGTPLDSYLSKAIVDTIEKVKSLHSY